MYFHGNYYLKFYAMNVFLCYIIRLYEHICFIAWSIFENDKNITVRAKR